jgi:hypothetical protein
MNTYVQWDLGPCGFAEISDPRFAPASFDKHGRYSLGNQVGNSISLFLNVYTKQIFVYPRFLRKHTQQSLSLF